MLDLAYEAGIRYVDAARSYGSAEAFLSSWLRLREYPADLVIGSKWGYRYVGGWQMEAAVHEVKDHSVAAFEEQLEESLALLGDSLALYQIHSATLESGVLEDQAVLAGLAALRERGVHPGLSVSGPRQADVIRRALDVEVDGVAPFETVQATWNLLEPSAGPALEEAHEAGWGVLVKEVLANGRLSAEAEPLGLPLDAIGPDRVALSVALTQPWVDVVLLGAVTEAQLLGDLDVDGELTDEVLAALPSLVEASELYWKKRSSLPWH
jgi:aryl-alcohol dehydrogenase-like predicted oxidoreductase